MHRYLGTGRAKVHEQVGPPAGQESLEQFLQMKKLKASDASPLREAEGLR